MATKPLTGRKVLAIALGAFGVIIIANMALVYAAIGSFPGLEVKNTYVASQSFDAERAAHARLGWDVKTTYVDGNLTLVMTDKTGNPAPVDQMRATIGRATHANADINLAFAQHQSPYSTTLPLAAGKWELRLKATAADGTAFRQRLSVIVSP